MDRASWRNAQNRDRPEMGRAQGGFYDTKRGWVDTPTPVEQRPCTDLGSLKPGGYRGVCGATIAPGETGPVQVYGGASCGIVLIDAVNHSECTFYLGDRITVFADKCCTAWFTGCSCCGSATPPPCCDRSATICIGREQKIVAFDGGTETWDVSECCGCEGAEVEVEITCADSVPTAGWTYTCGETVITGSINLSALCSDDPVELLDQLSVPCDGLLSDRWANFIEECGPCGTLPECESCIDFGSFTEGLPNPADIGPTNIVMSNDVRCTGQQFTATITITNNSGGAWVDGEVYFGIQYNTAPINLDVETVSATPALASATSPLGGTSIAGTWTGLNLANGATAVYSVTVKMNACALGGLFIAGVPMGFDSDVDFACVACP